MTKMTGSDSDPYHYTLPALAAGQMPSKIDPHLRLSHNLRRSLMAPASRRPDFLVFGHVKLKNRTRPSVIGGPDPAPVCLDNRTANR